MQKNEKNVNITPPFIVMNITTTDSRGNYIQVSEKRVVRGNLQQNPTIDEYCKIFTNLLKKQEFSNEEIFHGLKDFFLKTDKKELSY